MRLNIFLCIYKCAYLVTWDCNDRHSQLTEVTPWQKAWEMRGFCGRGDCIFFLFVILSCLRVSPPPHQHVQFWKLEKKGGGRAKDVNCTNVTHIVASGRQDPVTFSYQWDMETGPAWQRSGWSGLASVQVTSTVCFPKQRAGAEIWGKGSRKGRKEFDVFTPCWFPPLPPSLPCTISN